MLFFFLENFAVVNFLGVQKNSVAEPGHFFVRIRNLRFDPDPQYQKKGVEPVGARRFFHPLFSEPIFLSEPF